ncbi:MAG: PBSX family phage terminase large subunit [Oscillospiraceae bacterium]|nr:PBSX family phage terminase large subunit [Oscillospiraceae bacterium]
MKTKNINLPGIVGKGYGTFWNYKGRYRVVKGSRASKKSKTMALWLIVNIMAYPQANALVIRKTFRTIADSCFTELQWAVNRLGVNSFWDSTKSPLEMTYKPTGQKIYFRGLDDPLKITSIAVKVGCLCWGWIEEAYEVMNENDFNILDESIRGKTEGNIFKQWTLTFNPWNEHHWIKKRFFDTQSDDVLALTTNYLCNEWLDKTDINLFNTMQKNNPRRYQVAGLGNWGISEGVIYDKWREERFNIDEIRHRANVKSMFGLDFGYTNDPSALFCGLICPSDKRIWVFDEIYQRGMSNELIAQEIENKGYAKESIIADNAEPKSIDRLKMLGIGRVKPAKKGRDSINHGVDFLSDFEIIVHPQCVNFITEISNYSWAKDKFGNTINKPIDDFNHLMDAMRYAAEPFSSKKTWIY